MSFLSVTVMLLMAAGLWSCDKMPTEPQRDSPRDHTSLAIDAEPDDLNAPWTLIGPTGYNHNGNGDATLSGLSAGAYTITWGPVSGWTTPADSTQTLTAYGTRTFTGTYVAQAGTITIDPDPHSITAPWQITGPNGFSQSGTGDTTLASMTTGSYTLTWGAEAGWTTPSPATVTQTLLPNGTLTFTGTYVALAGTITIDPEPNNINAPWQISGPMGFDQSGTGDATLPDMTPGNYTLIWGAVTDWTTPSPATVTQTLLPNGTLTFTGTYVTQAGAITIDPEPNNINAPWQISGPVGFNQSGTGDATLPDMTPGSYTLIWGAVTDWTTPSPATVTQTLLANETLAFTGVYIEDPEVPPVGFVSIPAGTFIMGSPTDEPGRLIDETQHQVTLTHGFYLRSTEVTNQQYMELAQWAFDHGYVTVNGSYLYDNLDGSTAVLKDLGVESYEISFSNGVFSCINPAHPVIHVTWYGSVAYCDWLSLQQGLPRAYSHSTWQCNGGDPYTAAGYRLPTEAEWEYACRAGSTTAFANGPITYPSGCSPSDPNLHQMGWYCGNTGGWTVGWTNPVAQKLPNTWGLYDMHGNSWEWCNDWSGTYEGPVTDPTGPDTGAGRVLRGGSWDSGAAGCRSAFRSDSGPFNRYSGISFRVLAGSAVQ